MAKRPVFVVVSGKKQHGKNFFTDKVKALLRKHNISYTETAFAAPIKRFVNDVFGIPLEDMETEEGKNKLTPVTWADVDVMIAEKFGKVYHSQGSYDVDPEYLTVREVLQVIGTDLFRERFFGPIWAQAPFSRRYLRDALYQDGPHVGREIVPVDVVFITDCRFPNEIEEGRKHDALFVRVVRLDPPVVGDTHLSETALDDYEWDKSEVVEAYTDDGRLDAYAENVLLPKILGRLHGN